MSSARDDAVVAHDPLKILHLVARSQRRGAELVALELADELSALGHRNRVIALGLGHRGESEPSLPVLVESTGSGPLDLIPRVRKLRRLLAGSPVDVVIAHGGWAAQVAALSNRRRGPLLVWQRIGRFSELVTRRSRRWWWRTIARRFDVGIALTGELERELRGIGFPGPIWVIPNSRNPNRFVSVERSAASARLRAEVGVPDGSHLVAFVGHLDRNKRGDRALEVHASVRARGSDAHLVVVGDGPLREELEATARGLGAGAHVSFLGSRSDVEWILGGSDLLLVTSDLEGIPGVAIEAAMAGCPVVSVPVGGVAEVVEHGVTGLVLPDASVDGMAAGVASLLAAPERRQAMSSAARQRSERFDSGATAQTLATSLQARLGDNDRAIGVRP